VNCEWVRASEYFSRLLCGFCGVTGVNVTVWLDAAVMAERLADVQLYSAAV